MSKTDYHEERFESRQAHQIAMSSADITEHFLRDARAQMDADNWDDALVTLRSALQMCENTLTAYSRLNQAILVLKNKVEERVDNAC